MTAECSPECRGSQTRRGCAAARSRRGNARRRPARASRPQHAQSAGSGQYYPDALLANPLRVEAFLGKRPGIALHNHRQPHGHRLAEAAGPRLADEVVRELHVAGHFLGEAFDENRRPARQRLQPRRQIPVVTAHQHQLPVGKLRAISSISAAPWPPNRTSPTGCAGSNPRLARASARCAGRSGSIS